MSLEIKVDNTVNSMLEALQRKSDYLCDVSNEKWSDSLLAPYCALTECDHTHSQQHMATGKETEA